MTQGGTVGSRRRERTGVRWLAAVGLVAVVSAGVATYRVVDERSPAEPEARYAASIDHDLPARGATQIPSQGATDALTQRSSTPSTPPTASTHGKQGHGKQQQDNRPTLRRGMTGTEVAGLQRRLGALGYQVRQATGRYDDETAHAVTAFEKVNGLHRDGTADPAVFAALEHPKAPRARGHNPGLAMEVDLTHQVTLVVRDGKVNRIYDVSTGAPVSPTPPGEFTVQYKIDGWRYAPLGPMWRPAYFTDTGIAFHGGEPVVTSPASHGCVRLTDPAMNELFPLLEDGTPVSVY